MKKYILVFGQDGDRTVDDVIEWIKCLSEVDIVRINHNDSLAACSVNFTPLSFSFTTAQGQLVESNHIAAYWYRRGYLTVDNIKWKGGFENRFEQEYFAALWKYYKDEQDDIINLIHFALKNGNIPCLNSFFDLNVNKLVNLDVAEAVGLEIPSSIVTNNIEAIRAFLERHERVIVKPIHASGFTFSYNGKMYSRSQCTSLFSFEKLEQLARASNKFQPTLFQAYVEKDFEIRSFYITGKIYSMAIFSQNNEKTSVDFRNYDDERPNRIVPFTLPIEIEQRLRLFMTKMDYQTGSIDMIYDGEKYTFLEVNTVGQLQWLSRNCNYHIEKDIATYLLKIAQ